MTREAPGATSLDAVLRFADRLEWSDDVADLTTLRDEFSVEEVRTRVRTNCASWRRDGLGLAALASRETTTHYKWFLGQGIASGVSMWLHEYKSRPARRAGYADSIHDHRYSFISWILSGSYVQEMFRLSDGAPVLAGRQELRAPVSSIVDADQIHRVLSIEDGTMTVVLQAPTRRGFSTEFSRDGVLRTHTDFATRLAHLRV